MFTYIATNRILHSERSKDKPPYAADDCFPKPMRSMQAITMDESDHLSKLINGSAEHFTFGGYNIWLRFPAAAYCYHGNTDTEIGGGDRGEGE